ncbi:MAG: D-alanyl-D-alanine carboxypeptidase family protein [Ruminococcaceae bacterium]|nr:D-alanyl-D-alanine carboxypeptidase family protein [Oscillospiraceae bacterium]
MKDSEGAIMKTRNKNNISLILSIATVSIVIILIIALTISNVLNKKPSDSSSDIHNESSEIHSDISSEQQISSDTSVISSEPSSSEASSSKPSSSSSPSSSQTTPSQKEYPDTPEGRLQEIEDDLNSDYLRVVSAKSPLPESFTAKTTTFKFEGFNVTVDPRIKDALLSFLQAAKKQGYVPNTISSYRSHAKQTQNYNNKVQQYINKGYSRAEAEKVAATIVAIPGTSEHEYGMTADICINTRDALYPETIEKMKDNIWNREHCAEYGFIVRYPKGKEEITGIMYEPWHFRYVGVKHAKIIMEKNLCLEEYVEMLEKERDELKKQLS